MKKRVIYILTYVILFLVRFKGEGNDSMLFIWGGGYDKNNKKGDIMKDIK